MAALLRAGKTVLIPFGGGQRYDLVFEDEEGFHRVQCKTARLRAGSARFNTVSIDRITAQRRSYFDEIDFFGVYEPTNAKVYLVPVEDAKLATECSLRVEPTKNSQAKNIRQASKYEI